MHDVKPMSLSHTVVKRLVYPCSLVLPYDCSYFSHAAVVLSSVIALLSTAATERALAGN